MLIRASAPSRAGCGLAALSIVLLILSFPDFNLWPLAWVGLVPLMIALLRGARIKQAFVLSWAAATFFFYGTCYWLTHAMVHYGGIPWWVAYPLLFPGAMIVGLFPALWGATLARVGSRQGVGRALALAPFAWAALEWARLGVTGQLWNAIGYSQAYVPALIQPARWGGVYVVGFLMVSVNAALAFALLKRDVRAYMTGSVVVCAVALLFGLSAPRVTSSGQASTPESIAAVVIGVQPNVSVNFGRPASETEELFNRHLSMSEAALNVWDQTRPRRSLSDADDTRASSFSETASQMNRDSVARIVVWPESPMNFTYAGDTRFRERVARFARDNHTSVIFNSLEPAPLNGLYNAAVLVDVEGRLVAQYDKIRLLPFGEYVPLPRWLPTTWLLTGLVGEFTPGDKYPLMPLGESSGGGRAGVFICFESAFPSISRTFADAGADVLINISNDGYLGRTPVMRQHLANTVFRAVENNRPVLRVTNTGISAMITPRGEVRDATDGFVPAVRTWAVTRAAGAKTFYTRHGDIFAACCAFISVIALAATLKSRSIKTLTKLSGRGSR